jgi:uncharacterized membrane protein
MDVEELFRYWAGYAALGLEAIAVILIAFGGAEAAIGVVRPTVIGRRRPFYGKKLAWVRFGVWLLIGLEFELGADVIRSAISPSWRQLGQLAAIAAIRTFLNFFLEKDIEKYAEDAEPGPIRSVDPTT